jgi:ubiquitin-conjugating enzyme E2 W
MTSSIAKKRILKDIQAFSKSPVEGIDLLDGENQKMIFVRIHGAKGTLYEGECYMLKMELSEDYPLSPPKVQFIHKIPKHPHVYPNGSICLDIISKKEWTPNMSLQGIAISVQSMLSSAKQKISPPDANVFMALGAPTHWSFHDAV